MPTLRHRLTRSFRIIILIAAVALAAAAIFDWTRPPQKQNSNYVFEHLIIAPYRLFVRPVTSRFVRCRYRPTCSAYVVEAVRIHGFPKGAWLGLKRVCSCGPWVPFGTSDPVPAR